MNFAHTWDFGTSDAQTRRAKAIKKRLLAAGIDCSLDKTQYGLRLTFADSDYKRAEEISDKCYVGESWWPTKGKGRSTSGQVGRR